MIVPEQKSDEPIMVQVVEASPVKVSRPRVYTTAAIATDDAEINAEAVVVSRSESEQTESDEGTGQATHADR